jgi:hypothetical protein
MGTPQMRGCHIRSVQARRGPVSTSLTIYSQHDTGQASGNVGKTAIYGFASLAFTITGSLCRGPIMASAISQPDRPIAQSYSRKLVTA